jgi:hypothetical protein
MVTHKIMQTGRAAPLIARALLLTLPLAVFTASTPAADTVRARTRGPAC